MTEAETRLLRLAQKRLHEASLRLYEAWLELQEGRPLTEDTKPAIIPFTKGATMSRSEADRPAHETNETEIEITPEMIAVGVEVYHSHGRALKNDVPGEERELVIEVFREMARLAQRQLVP